MNINELNALRRLWATAEIENLNLAWQLAISQNAQHLLEAEMLVAGLFCEDTELVISIENYFSEFCEAAFLLFTATFELSLYAENEITKILYQNWQRLAAIHHRLQLADLANALMRFTGFGVDFVLENNLSEQVDFELFVRVLKNTMYYNARKVYYEKGIFYPEVDRLEADFKLSLPYSHIQFLPRAVYELSELHHLELLFPNSDAAIPADISRLKNLNQLTFLGNGKSDSSLDVAVPDLSILGQVEKWNFNYVVNVSQLETFLSKIPKAASIELKNCKFSHFSISDAVREQLKVLYIDGYEDKILPADIAPLPNLTHLSVYRCPLKRFPANFSQFKQLTVLGLEGLKRLKKFPPFIFSCGKIRYIWAANTLINELPAEISRLKCLESFYFTGHLIEKLPDTFAKLSRLKHVSLNKNNFKKYPTLLSQLPIVESIDFSSNFLTSFEHILPLPPTLNYIDLSYAFNNSEVKNQFIALLSEQSKAGISQKIRF